ncbi:MAG: helix-turn-helix transcriptional regulator [Butyrivibrio sp.]|nr:helix-turn-helix transcriptional regulator [Butyrivibrio sp.]
MVLLGEKLRALRERKGLTLEQTSELLGVAVSTVSSY